MEIKIKNQNQLIDATIEVVDGVMIVSPKEEQVDITKFNDGDVITCGWSEGNQSYNWTCILHGEIEYISDNMFIGDYCSLDCKGEFLDRNSGSDSATWVTYATEEEKKKLFDRLAEEGLDWDPQKKELVKLKWEPICGQTVFLPDFKRGFFRTLAVVWLSGESDSMLQKGMVFNTQEECQVFCDKLNQAISLVRQ